MCDHQGVAAANFRLIEEVKMRVTRKSKDFAHKDSDR